MKRAHAAAVAALVVLAVPSLSGCFSGKEATTNMQATMNSGNSVTASVGSLRLDGVTFVLDESGANGTLVVRVSNLGAEDDTLTSGTIGGADAFITPGKNAIPAGAVASFGFESDAWINAYGLTDVPAASYVPVHLVFEKAGPVDMSVLAVPPVGYYAGIAPNPPMGAVASPEPIASAS